MDETDNWHEYRRLVLGALQRIDDELSGINDKIDKQDGVRSEQIADMRIEIGMLKVKAAMWSMGASAVISGAVGLIINLLAAKGK